jgi:hypothetical protein
MVDSGGPERSDVLRNGTIIAVLGLIVTVAFLLVALRGTTTGTIDPDLTPPPASPPAAPTAPDDAAG